MRWLRKHRIEVKYALIAVGLLAALAALQGTGALDHWVAALDPFLAALGGLGLLGAFLLGLVGNSSLMLQVPYTVPILSAALAGSPLPYLLGLGAAAGIGATAGELVSYTIADQILRHQQLSPSRLYRWVHVTVAAHPRAIPWLVFGFAATLLPDDAVLIPLAMVSYGALRLLLPLLLGKLAYCLGSAVLFDLLGDRAAAHIPASVTADLAIVLVVGLVLVVLYQAEAGRARGEPTASVTSTSRQEAADGTQGSDRQGRGLRRRRHD